MKKSFRFIALFVATLLAITGLAVVALAEPSDAPLTGESLVESAEVPSADASVAAPAESAPSSDTSVPSGDVSSEVSAENSDSSDASSPEVSAPEVSAPEVSEPEVSEPEVSEPEVSEPPAVTPEKPARTITFTVNGNGSVSVYTRNDTLLATITGGTQAITVRENIYFVINNGNLRSIDWNEPHRAVDNAGNYYLNPSMDSYVNINFEGTGGQPNTSQPDTSDPDTSVPENSASNHTVRVNAGSGGTVTAGDRTINGGNGTNVLVKSGETIVFTVAPDDGYELESFKVDGSEVELTDNTYTLENITANATVAVIFRTIGGVVAPEGISVTDIDWSAENVTVDVSGGKAVLREVFDKIATLTPEADKYIAFVSENATVYVPYGGVSVGTSATVNMSVSALTEGADYSAILALYGGEASFKAYSFDVSGNVLPSGTKVSFELGADYANTQAVLLTYDGTILSAKGDALAVSADGKSAMYDYSNESLLVCASGAPGQFTIESILVNVGGDINPLGISNVTAGTDSSYVVRAIDGYTIKQILVDDVALENVEGSSTYIHIFENVGANHTIKVEFAANETVSGDNTEEDGGNGTVIVVLVIVLVAVLGAAALFIVKWRQEKF